MSESVAKHNDPLSTVSDDDEDLFASAYEQPAKTEQKLNHEEPVVQPPPVTAMADINLDDDDQQTDSEPKEISNGAIPTPPTQNSSIPQHSSILNTLESEMNTIDLNDSKFDKEDQSSVKEIDDNLKKEPTTTGIAGMKPLETVPIESHQAELPQPSVTAATTKSSQQPAVITPSQITITIAEPQKIGDGMGSYVVYSVSTRTTLPYFRRQSMTVNRRFSDFLGLHSKLSVKHGPSGRIIPPPPAKSAVGTAKVKMAKDDSIHSMDFLAKRRAALERYLQRTAEHPVLCSDPDFREFLELDTELPRSTSTSALSGAGLKRMFSLFGDTVNKMTFRMEESDPVSFNQNGFVFWFESKQQQIEILDTQFRKLYAAVELLIYNRKELSTSLGVLGKGTALIGHDENNVSLSCALSHLAATHEKVEKIYETQANHDFLYLSELLRDYIGMIGAVREAFHERVKCFQNLTTLEQTLTRKQESKAKLELTLKNERPTSPQIDDEIRDLQERSEKAKEDFEKISETIKQEFERFDISRLRDFRNNFLKYMESLLQTQEALIECWETFLPEARSISA
uniref:Sorting nexin-2-like isoform X2 n=1 Tax=Dermatophagoides pteronyssinus TaxID=6956 RepID=A0A6P6YM98_DERPT|nr:sorting nexin-2-like isoform X2 [Dermatophagoides pteronyssinus]